MRAPEETNLQIRITKAEKEKLKAIANSNGKTLSGYLRDLYMAAVAEYDGSEVASFNGAEIKRKEYTPGKKEWCSCIYKTNAETKRVITELATKLDTTPSLFIKKLMMDWLNAKTNGLELENVEITKRTRGAVENNEKIYIQLTLQEKTTFKTVLSELDRTMPALIDTLIDNYTKSQHDESEEV